jgi:hypothetical protein
VVTGQQAGTTRTDRRELVPKRLHYMTARTAAGPMGCGECGHSMELHKGSDAVWRCTGKRCKCVLDFRTPSEKETAARLPVRQPVRDHTILVANNYWTCHRCADSRFDLGTFEATRRDAEAHNQAHHGNKLTLVDDPIGRDTARRRR